MKGLAASCYDTHASFLYKFLTRLSAALLLSHEKPSITASCQVHFWFGKTIMAGLQSGEDHMMIDLVIWAQYINVSDTLTARQGQGNLLLYFGTPLVSMERLK